MYASMSHMNSVYFTNSNVFVKGRQARLRACKPVTLSRRRYTAPIRAEGSAAASLDKLDQSSFQTSSGLNLEILSASPSSSSGPSTRPPLLFIHGSYHAAWCWGVHFLPYFADHGYQAFALSLRGQGKSDSVSSTPKLDEHVADVVDFVGSLPQAPVLVGHSFGGAVVQRLLSTEGPTPAPLGIPGAVLACSVPPYGNAPMIGRFLKAKPIASLRLTWSLAARGWEGRPGLFRESFFSESLPEDTLMEYMDLMSANSNGSVIDVSDFNGIVPLVPPPQGSPAVMVLGTEEDFVVDQQGIFDTAQEYGVSPVLLKNIAHDIMLDTNWTEAAEAIQTWLDDNLTSE